jgi:hypothetical protein
MRRILAASGMLAAVMFLLAPVSARAASITYTLGPNDFSGSGANVSGPFTVTLTDVGGGVQMSVDTSGLSGSEFVSGLYLNFDPTLAIGSLTAGYTSGIAADSVQIATDCCKADGDGLYDILFSYPTSGNTLGDNDTSVYLFAYSGAGTFNISSFSFISTPDGGNGPFLIAAHVQSLAGGKSAWVYGTPTTATPTTENTPTTGNTPEPASLLLLGMGLLVTGRRLRRKIS